MNTGHSMRSMLMACSSGGRRLLHGIGEQFPAGLRVLVVDDDLTCLRILEKMLRKCAYEVTQCSQSEAALRLLRGNRNGYDIVLSDVHMPNMDGFKLLEYIGLEMDLPVIMMSADDRKDFVLKGVTHGACDYLIKPVRIEALKNIWQHVFRKKKNEFMELEQLGSVEDGDRFQKPSEDAGHSSTANKGDLKCLKRKNGEEDEGDDKDDSSTLKKPRVVWSVNLHQQFVLAVNQLGTDKAVPKKILELMNVPGLTRENVASHLQKYRIYLKKTSGQPQHQSGLNNSFLGTQEPSFGQMHSFNALHLQALASFNTANLSRSSAKCSLPLPFVDQGNLFRFESPKLQEGHQQGISSTGKQMNMVHGVPSTMEPKQRAGLHRSCHSLGSLNEQASVHANQAKSLLMSVAQPQLKGQVLNEAGGGYISALPSSVAPPVLSGGIPGSTVLHAPLAMDFPLDHTVEQPIQGGFNWEMKVSGGFIPGYSISSDLHQHKSHNWALQGVGLNFDASQHSTSPTNSSLPVLVQQGVSSAQIRGLDRCSSQNGKTVFTLSEELLSTDAWNSSQQVNTFIDNSLGIKAETIPGLSCQPALVPGSFIQDDPMTQLLKQDDIGPHDEEFGMYGFCVDDVPVQGLSRSLHFPGC